jgi:hypothetical protein
MAMARDEATMALYPKIDFLADTGMISEITPCSVNTELYIWALRTVFPGNISSRRIKPPSVTASKNQNRMENKYSRAMRL